jgi:surfactin synthase thioesterase subunit
MRRHAVTDQLSISSLAERLADVTAVVMSVGEESSGQLANETALALTERLETEAAAFPGDHMDIVTQPEEFAEKLHDVLQADWRHQPSCRRASDSFMMSGAPN